MLENFVIGDVVSMKKPHACGTNAWEITRVGADIKLRCKACGRLVMMDRVEFLRRAKKILEHKEQSDEL